MNEVKLRRPLYIVRRLVRVASRYFVMTCALSFTNRFRRWNDHFDLAYNAALAVADRLLFKLLLPFQELRVVTLGEGKTA